MNNIIENRVSLKGDDDTVKSILKMLKGKENVIDFNKIKPMEEKDDDLILDDKMNICLNIYLQDYKGDRDNLINALKFIGRTRKVPFEFYEISEEKLSNIRDNNIISEMINEANRFLDKVKNKSIFNGYIIRETWWGTGSGAANAKVNGNVLEFTTYDKAPLKVFEELSILYPCIEIDYYYKVGDLEKRKSIKRR